MFGGSSTELGTETPLQERDSMGIAWHPAATGARDALTIGLTPMIVLAEALLAEPSRAPMRPAKAVAAEVVDVG
jgi:hypothetical protein